MDACFEDDLCTSRVAFCSVRPIAIVMAWGLYIYLLLLNVFSFVRGCWSRLGVLFVSCCMMEGDDFGVAWLQLRVLGPRE